MNGWGRSEARFEHKSCSSLSAMDERNFDVEAPFTQGAGHLARGKMKQWNITVNGRVQHLKDLIGKFARKPACASLVPFCPNERITVALSPVPFFLEKKPKKI